MDVASLRLDSLNLRVDACKQFTPPSWALPGHVSENGAALHVIKGGEVVDTLKIDDSRLYTLFGRFPNCGDSGGVSVRLEHPSVSRVHAAVLRGPDNAIFCIDLGSCHGTYVSGKRLEPYSAVPLHDRCVIVFGQSSRRYIVRVFPKNVSACMGAEEVNTLLNSLVGYKERSPAGTPAAACGGGSMATEEDDRFAAEAARLVDEQCPPKMERRVSFSCLAPEIIPLPVVVTTATPPAPTEGSSTPLSVMGGSPEVTWFRKSLQASPRALLTHAPSTFPEQLPLFRNKSDSLPSIQANSGSDEDDEGSSSLESLELSPVLSTIDEMNPVSISSESLVPTGRKSFYKRLPARFEVFSKRIKPGN